MNLVYFSSGDVIILGKRNIEEALVISQIQINLSPSQNITQRVEIEHQLGGNEIKACRGEINTGRRKKTSPPSSRTKTSPCSKGDMVPASMFKYGSAWERLKGEN